MSWNISTENNSFPTNSSNGTAEGPTPIQSFVNPGLIPMRFALASGVVGFVANGVALTTMLANKKLRNKTSYFLINYQVLLDFLSCLALVVSYALILEQAVHPAKMKVWGYEVCIMFVGEGLVYMLLYAAIPNLGVIAFERYMKVVHPIIHRNYFRRWMLYMAVVLSIIQGILLNIPLFWTSALDTKGVCHAYTIWSRDADQQVYAIICALWLYVFLLAEMLYCYGRIITTLRKRTAIGPAVNDKHAPANHGAGNNLNQVVLANPDEGVRRSQHKPSNQDEGISRQQVNVIKTMILISVTYAVTTFLNNFGYVAYSFDNNTPMIHKPQYYINVALYYVNVWIDPFIYVLGNKEVRQLFIRYMSCNSVRHTIESTTG